ncbi:EthD family reductase [Pseudomonas putida]|uniref:EthD family reductase n=1 Tax=Pseudomonas TaxID=286 RepID=UPI0003609D8F|nr:MULTISPECIES: EthD family reductase [Pseudomonas]PJX08511.1 EthD family reductase [Pseudomonas putida]HCF5435960.1 EthD family reductase [Pseudomonas aeruginosa]
MHKLVVMYPQPLDSQKFMDYYERNHLPKAKDLPGLISAEYGRNDDPDASIFVMFTALFADKDSLDKALRSDVGMSLAKDIPNFSAEGVTMMSLSANQLVLTERLG